LEQESAQSKQKVIPVRKKRTYRAKEINTVRISEIVAGHEGCAATVGIDVGKDDLFLMLRWGAEMFSGPWHAENRTGIRGVVEFLLTLSHGRELIVALEPTGTYGDALRYALTQVRLNVHRVEGKASHAYAEIFDGVPSQHDRKDAAVVAELAAVGKSKPWPYDAESVENQERKCWVQRLEAAQGTMQVGTGRLEGLLARHWPEATQVMQLNSVSLLKTLAHYGGPEELAQDAEATVRLAGWGRSLLTAEKIQALVKTAKETVGVPQGRYDREWVQECAQEILDARRKKQQAKRALKRLGAGNEVLTRLGAAATRGRTMPHESVGNPSRSRPAPAVGPFCRKGPQAQASPANYRTPASAHSALDRPALNCVRRLPGHRPAGGSSFLSLSSTFYPSPTTTAPAG
jgi:hypothetical protein